MRSRKAVSALLPYSLMVTGLATAQSARANTVDVQAFTPASGTSYVYSEDALMQVAPGDSTWTGERLYFHLLYNYAHDPLVELNAAGTARTNVLIGSFSTFDTGIGILPLKNLMFSVNFPLNLVNEPGTSSQFALGDARFLAKYRFTEDGAPVAVAVFGGVGIPSGNQTYFLSNGFGEMLGFAVERDFGPFRVSGNLGYRHYANAVFQDIDYSNQLPMSLSAYIPLDDRWGINLEGAGSLSLPVNSSNNPSEFYLGGHFQASQDASFLLGASTGSITGSGSLDFRVIAGVKFSPMDAIAPKKPTPTPAPAAHSAIRQQNLSQPGPVTSPPKTVPARKKKVLKKKPAKKKSVKKSATKKKPAPKKRKPQPEASPARSGF